MWRWYCVFLLISGITGQEFEERRSKLPFIADAVGNTLSPPTKGPVGSPSNLLTPDRYEFYTFDDSGELVKRLMTLEEIQAIVAAGDGTDGHLVTFASDDRPPIAFNFSQAPFTKVHSVVTNVQNVLKAQMEAHKKNPPFNPSLDTPDVSDSWSLILPTIFGNTGGDIVPDKTPSSYDSANTDILELSNPLENDDSDNSLSKENTNNILSSEPTQKPSTPRTVVKNTTPQKTESTTVSRPKVSTTTTTTTTTTSKPKTVSSTIKPRLTSTTSKPLSSTKTYTIRTSTSTTTSKPTTASYKSPSPTPQATTSTTTTTTARPKLTSTTTTTTTTKVLASSTTTSTTPRPRTTSTTAIPKPSVSRGTTSTTTEKPRSSTQSTTTPSSKQSITRPTFIYKRPSVSTTSAPSKIIQQTTHSTYPIKEITEQTNNYIPVSTVTRSTTEKYIERTTQAINKVFPSIATTRRYVTIARSTTSSPKTSTASITTHAPPVSSTKIMISTTEKPLYIDRINNATTITTQSVSPTTTVSSTEYMTTDTRKPVTSAQEEPAIPLFDMALSISQIASDLGNYQGPSKVDTSKITNNNLELESKENIEIDIPNDTKIEKESVENPLKDSQSIKNSTSNKITNQKISSTTTTEASQLLLTSSSTIDPILSESMGDVLSQVFHQSPHTIIQNNNNTSNNIISNLENNLLPQTNIAINNSTKDYFTYKTTTPPILNKLTSTIGTITKQETRTEKTTVKPKVSPTTTTTASPEKIIIETSSERVMQKVEMVTNETHKNRVDTFETTSTEKTVTNQSSIDVTLNNSKSDNQLISEKNKITNNTQIDNTTSNIVVKPTETTKQSDKTIESTKKVENKTNDIKATSTFGNKTVNTTSANINKHNVKESPNTLLNSNSVERVEPNQNSTDVVEKFGSEKEKYTTPLPKEEEKNTLTNDIQLIKIPDLIMQKPTYTENNATSLDVKTDIPKTDAPKIEEFKKKIQKVNIDDKEFANNRNNSWKLIPTVIPPKNNEIPQESNKISSHPQESENPNKDINLDVSKENQGLEVTTKDLSTDIALFTELCNELAFKYWSEILKDFEKKRSFVLSPYSITSMLAMMFMGARGGTSGEMNEILKLDDMVTFNPHFTLKNISDSIETSPEAGVVASAFVRELYSDRDRGKILTFYKERAQHFYSGHVEEVNFKLISDIIRRRTNLLIKRHTWGRISEYLKTNSITMQPPLAAFSANIFQTDCSGSSVDGRDGEMYFVVSPTVRQRRLVPVPAVVYRKGFLAGYDPVLDATAAALGNTDSIVSTLFLMPGQQGNVVHADDLESLEKRLLDNNPTTPAWNRLLRTLLPRVGLELQIPRFSHKSIFNISGTLKKMGLKDLFAPELADLGGLNGPTKELYVSDMIQHSTFITCGEGVIADQHHIEEYPENLKVTRRRRTSRWSDWDEPRDYQRAFHDPHDVSDAMQLPLHLRPRQARLPARNAQPARLKFDRPFLYFVRHNPSGMILYVGRYNPRLLP